MTKNLDLFTDGACSGNPGMGGIGVVIKEQGKTIQEISVSLDKVTNNVAEYMAVIYGLQEALILRADAATVHTDSELLFRQVKGDYQVKNENLKPLFEQIRHLAKGFRNLAFKQIPRTENQEADRLAKQAVKKEQAKMVASEFNFGEESPSSKG